MKMLLDDYRNKLHSTIKAETIFNDRQLTLTVTDGKDTKVYPVSLNSGSYVVEVI